MKIGSQVREVKWQTKDRIDISSQDIKRVVISKDSKSILLYSDSDIYFTFCNKINTAAGTLSANNDIILKADTLYEIPIPMKKYGTDSAYIIEMKQVSSAGTKYCRIIEL